MKFACRCRSRPRLCVPYDICKSSPFLSLSAMNHAQQGLDARNTGSGAQGPEKDFLRAVRHIHASPFSIGTHLMFSRNRVWRSSSSTLPSPRLLPARAISIFPCVSRFKSATFGRIYPELNVFLSNFVDPCRSDAHSAKLGLHLRWFPFQFVLQGLSSAHCGINCLHLDM